MSHGRILGYTGPNVYTWPMFSSLRFQLTSLVQVNNPMDYGQLLPKTSSIQDKLLLVPRTTHTQENSYLGLIIHKTRTWDKITGTELNWYPAQLMPNITHANCFGCGWSWRGMSWLWYKLYSVRAVLCMSCPLYELTWVHFILGMTYLVCELSRYWCNRSQDIHQDLISWHSLTKLGPHTKVHSNTYVSLHHVVTFAFPTTCSMAKSHNPTYLNTWNITCYTDTSW